MNRYGEGILRTSYENENSKENKMDFSYHLIL